LARAGCPNSSRDQGGEGGKKLSFRAIVVVGNEKGQVGVGVGKAGDVIGAVKKGVADGKKAFG
jgi:small subunit ribosomal protein S5